MRERFNEPDYSFVLESLMPSGRQFEIWRVDQVSGNPRSRHAIERLTNTIERHLHSLHKQTGLDYSCIACGPVSEIDKFCSARNLEL